MNDAKQFFHKACLWLFGFAVLAVVVGEIPRRLSKPKTQFEFRCVSCGSEFISSNPNAKDVNTCPNCPLTWEEFEELQKKALENSK